MFETLPSPSLDVLLIAGRAILLVGALCVFALAFIRWRRTDEMNNQRLQQQLQHQLDRTFVELRSLHETVMVMSARLEGLSERTEVGTRLAPAGIAAPQRGYDMAARLAKNGADIDELVANCGITRHEAELLVRLHSAKRTGGEVAIGRLKQQAQESTRAPVRVHERAPAQSWPMQSAEVELAERQQVAAAAAAGRKRGSLLSVVG
ncbi:MAG TPA: DUF2802 domain-containing protein [Steroidobacteraceae bacterium]|nr:DUF2802 domain-containing protein [Steroidobacteraceae bacterium]